VFVYGHSVAKQHMGSNGEVHRVSRRMLTVPSIEDLDIVSTPSSAGHSPKAFRGISIGHVSRSCAASPWKDDGNILRQGDGYVVLAPGYGLSERAPLERQELDCDGTNDFPYRRWYALHTRSRCEKKVHAELCGKGLESYLPLYRARRRWSDRTVEVELPLFTSYLFTKIDLQSDEYFSVMNAKHVVRLVGQGKDLVPVSDDDIDAIKRVLSLHISAPPLPWLQEGKRVRVAAGPLCGLEGVVDRAKSNTRFFLLVKSIGQSIVVDVDARDIVPV